MKKYIVTIIILFSIIVLSVGGYFIYVNAKTNESNSDSMLKEKCISEIEFLSSDIINMMNDINNISYSNFKIVNKEIDISDNKEQNTIETENTINSTVIVNDNILNNNNTINWETLNEKIEYMYSSWPTIMMDLTSLNVNKDNLLKYNDNLDKITKDFQNKDKKSSLIHLADLYSLIESYVKDVNADAQMISLITVKKDILYAYAWIEDDDWNKVIEYIGKAKTEFTNIINNQLNNMNNIDVINKSYILINELEKNSNNKDKEIFYINYKNLMQELENID